MLDNGDNTKTSTLQFGGASAQTLDLTNIRTSADTVLIGMNLHTTGTIDATSGVLQTNNVTRIDNNGNGSFAGLTSTGAVTVGYSIPAFNVPYSNPYIVAPNDYFIETIFNTGITLPASSSYPGRVIKIANMCPNPLTINFAPGDHTITNPPLYSFSLTLNSGTCITLISDGGFSGWVQAGH